MTIALFVKNKLRFIDCSILKPAGDDLDLLNSRIRSNNIVISWILNSVSRDISTSIIFSGYATECDSIVKINFNKAMHLAFSNYAVN